MSKQNLRRKTPIMGWASWNCFRTNISEEKLKEQARALVESGLSECGYTYFNIDDGFFGGRDENGRLQFHQERFPHGIKVMADYAHELGLKAGIYSEGGDKTCGYYYDNEGKNGDNVGLYGHEEEDLSMYLEECGFDFIKVDWCGGLRMGLDEETQYTRIGRIIDQIRERTGRQIVYNVCRWQFPGPWVVDVADSWRTAADIEPNFSSILHQLDNIKPLAKYCGPGHVNDLDMMQIGNGLSHEEERTHFSMWCMLSTPLMIGCDLTALTPETLALLKNQEMIAIHQDEVCEQAFVVKEVRSEQGALLGEVWIKKLGGAETAKKAVAFLNRSEQEISFEVSLAELGLSGKLTGARDVWRHCEVAEAEGCAEGDGIVVKHKGSSAGEEAVSFCVRVPAHGVEVLCLEAEAAVPVADVFDRESVDFENIGIQTVSDEEAQKLIEEGAVLVDVRTPEEYQRGHLPGARNLPYTDVHAEAPRALDDRKQKLVLYCSTGKRSAQAGQSLKYLGYSNVYTWKREEF